MSTKVIDISINEVTKEFPTGIFKKKLAVDKLTLDIPRGQIVGLLGANGSGKSTTIKMILGFLKPTHGQIFVCDQPAGTRQSRALIGYLPENPRFQKFLRGEYILNYYGKLYGLSGKQLSQQTDHMLDLVGLKHARAERVGGYSKGMTQRLAIAQALMNRPKLLIFDEPMSGLDPLGRMEIRDLIRAIHDGMPETTIFFSTHILSDVEALCSSVALLKKGVLKTACEINQLMVQDGQFYSIVVTGINPALESKYRTEHGASSTSLGLSFNVESIDMLTARLSEISRAGGTIVSVNTQRRGLEEILFSDRKNENFQFPRQAAGGA
jgi:ABC-2 type transport system ATP-binding protein